MKRILGVDPGIVRTGISVSDLSCTLASGVGTIVAYNEEKLISQVSLYAAQFDVDKIVVGYPLNMDGTEGPRSIYVKGIAEKIAEATGCEVILFDERMTTVVAFEYMNATNTRGKKRKKKIDTLAAEIILQDYLDSLKNKLN
ncbi:MAG: Holliday junction resolvase RuvX [Clostridia bacterium]|nr:Holliday junction resolvase RuvX [Clostridia bacterium]